MIPIPGSSRPATIRASAEAADLVLTPDQLDRLNQTPPPVRVAPMNDLSTPASRELHEDYVEQVNLAVAEDRDDLVQALAAQFAATQPPQSADAHARHGVELHAVERHGVDSVGGGGSSSERAHGPLPVLLILLTVVTGLVDAFSYLSLGHVFVANMTGNVVFLGFALSGAGSISLLGSLLAVLAFALGAALGGRWAPGRRLHRGHLLASATSGQAALLLAGSVIASTTDAHGTAAQLSLIGLLALAMGGQNAVVRRLAVPDLTTTVLTLTVTGLVADTTSRAVRTRRLASVLSMLAGALTGGALLHWVAPAAPLWLATATLATCALTAYRATSRTESNVWR